MKMINGNVAVKMIVKEEINKTAGGLILPTRISEEEFDTVEVIYPDKDNEFKVGEKLAVRKHSGIAYNELLIIHISNVLFII